MATFASESPDLEPPVAIEGGRSFYHPVRLAQQALAFLQGYAERHDERSLALASEAADRLRAMALDVDGASFLPYVQDFALHGADTDVMRAPWFSAMAQGEALSLASRLWAITKEPRHLEFAGRLAASLDGTANRGGPSVTHIDAAGYLWLDEYPGEVPDLTLNGFVFAVYGLYDYQALTGDPGTLATLDGALTTLRRYAADYRNPGGISFYCLAHLVQSIHYHGIHVVQLSSLSRMTGDSYFAALGERIQSDGLSAGVTGIDLPEVRIVTVAVLGLLAALTLALLAWRVVGR